MRARSISPGYDDAGEPRAVGANAADVAVQAGVDDRLARDAVRAQTVQDRPGKPCRRSEFRIGMQWIAVTAQPVQQRLLRQRSADGTS